MFGSPDAYNSTPAGNRRHDNRLKGQQKAYDSSKAAAESQGYVVQGDNKFKRVPDATSPNGFRLINQGKISVEKYGRTEIKDVKSTKPSAYTSNTEVKPSSFLKVETPTQNPERPTTPGVSGAEVPALGGGTYSVMGVKYDSATGQAINPGTGKTFSGGYAIEPKTGGRTDYSGGETRVSPTNVVQRGTSTSPKPMTMDDANKLLSGGYKIENPYSGNQLPTTASSPYAGKSNSQIYNPETLHQHDSEVDYVSLSKDIYKDQSGVATYQRGKNMNADYKQMDVNPGQKVPEEKINWANRTMADNSDEKVRRRSAMLDNYNGADGNPVGLMERMRNQEAIQGRKYAGGHHWQVNKNAGQEGQDDFVKISAGQSRARSNYTKTADEVFANHLGKAKDTVASQDIPDLPKDAPAPLPDAVPHNTSMDNNPHDTKDLLNMKPSKSIIGDNTPYTSVNRGTLLR